MNYGFVKVATAVPLLKIADCSFNKEQIEGLIIEASKQGVQFIVFPELSITAYTCGDLFGHQLLIEEAEMSMMQLLNDTRHCDILCVVGLPVATDCRLFNTAVVFQRGKILGVVPKTYLPNYKEFYEKRWFASAQETRYTMVSLCGQTVPFGAQQIFSCSDASFAVELCEDLWMPIPPSSIHAMQGADIIANLSASNELIGKHDYLLSLIQQQSARCMSGYLYASSGFGESTTDLVFAGNGIIAENGSILAKSDRFSFEKQLIVSEIDIDRLRFDRRVHTDFATGFPGMETLKYQKIPFEIASNESATLIRPINKFPFVPEGNLELDNRCEEIFNIQVSALAQRVVHTGAASLVIGISGGLDSSLALLVCVKTLDKLHIPREKIIGVTMPGFGTTDRTYRNAIDLMTQLGITSREIDIKEACIQHFADIGHDISVQDVTYENSQARERTQLLMDIANQTGGLVIGTGDLSELALGWATYNGDHMSMYGVNVSIPKTLVRYLVSWVAQHEVEKDSMDTLLDIVNTPISPELIPADEQGDIVQKTEDIVGPYELHDFFLYYFLRFGFRPAKIFYLTKIAFGTTYTDKVIRKWLTTFFRRFFSQQFKRTCLPDGPKVGSISISPRGDWRMPSDASSALWMKECEELPPFD